MDNVRCFYKAFMTKKGDTEVMMKVDTSGDEFSPTVIDAIRTLYTNGLGTADLFHIPFFSFFSDKETDADGEPIEVPKPADAIEEFTDRITILRITPLNQDQTDAAIIDGELEGKMCCLAAMKNLTDGYNSAIMEYCLEKAETVQYKGTNTWVLRKFIGNRTMDTDSPDIFPEKLEWSMPKKYRKPEKDVSMSVTQF